jgi:hypothetical protein
MKEDTLKTLRKYFLVDPVSGRPDKWLIACKNCDSMWYLNKSSEGVGNVLQLLNHASSHEKGN